MSIVFSGVTDLQKVLAYVRQQMCNAAAVRAVREGGQVILEAMVERTPVQEFRNLGSDSLEEGEMKANMTVRAGIKEGVARARIGPANGERVPKAAWLVEYGHRIVHGGSLQLNAAGILVGEGKAHDVDVPAHPFLRPAYEASAAPAVAAMTEALKTELAKAAK